MKPSMPYSLKQLLWMLKSAFELMFLMSTGFLWVQQMVRLYIYAGFVWMFFVPHWWWYLTSANIIRRVSYRSSHTTKRRNILRVLEAEGVADVAELLRRERRLQRQQRIRAARGLSGQPRPLVISGTGPRRRPPPPPPPPPPHTTNPAGCAVESSVSGSPGHSPTVSAPHRGTSPSTGRRVHPPPPRRPARAPAGRAAPPPPRGPHQQPHSQSPPPDVTATDDAHTSPLWRPFTPAVPQSPEHRAASPPPDVQALEQLMRRSRCFASVNPADGSLLRSLPRESPAPPPPTPPPPPPTRTSVLASPSAHSTPHSPHRSPAAQASGPSRPRYTEGSVRVADDGDSSSAAALCADPRFQPFLEAFPTRHGEDEDSTCQTTNGATLEDDASLPLTVPSAVPAALRKRPPPQRRRPPPPPPIATPPSADLPSSSRSGADWVDMDDEDEEDRLNLHNRATVDIVLPVPLDSLMKSMDYAKRSSRLRRKKFPIVIDVSGGAWIIGSHLWSTMLARVLAARGYVVFCPDYRNFPQTTMEGMTLDVSDAIAWVLNNAERYNGDLNDVTLMGQSAGAHLTMMSLLSQAHLCAYEAARSLAQDGTSVPPPSPVAYNVPRYNPRRAIHRYIGLSGIYNIERLAPHFHRRGLNTPVLQKIAGGREQLPRYSIHAYFDRRRGGDTGEVLPDNFFDFLPQRMFFLHGDADTAAPVTESSSLVGVLRQAQMEFTLRRLTRNEESRRHAFRSRGLVPGALSTPIELHRHTFAQFSPANDAQAHLAPHVGQEDVEEPGPSADDRSDSNSSEHQRSRPLSAGHTERSATSLGGGGETDGAEEQCPHTGGTHRTLALCPIVPPSRSDLPLTAVDLEFILIPDATHTDAIIEECIVGLRSCCADFICDYLTEGQQSASALSPVVPVKLPGAAAWSAGELGSPTHMSAQTLGAMTATSLSPTAANPFLPSTGSAWESSWADTADADYVRATIEKVTQWSRSVEHCVPPDGLLPLAVPREDRPKVLNWVTYFSPF